MKHLNKIIAAAVISGVTLAGASMAVQAKNPSVNDAVAATNAAVTLEQAIGIAKQVVPGTASKAEFSTDEAPAVWEIEIIGANQQVFDIEVDPTSGKVLKQKVDKADNGDDDDDDDDENGAKDDDDDKGGNDKEDKEDRD